MFKFYKNEKFKTLFLFLLPLFAIAQHQQDFSVIAYYTGDNKKTNDYDVSKLTHIVFSFCHLKDGKLSVDSTKDSITIKQLISLKEKNPMILLQ